MLIDAVCGPSLFGDSSTYWQNIYGSNSNSRDSFPISFPFQKSLHSTFEHSKMDCCCKLSVYYPNMFSKKKKSQNSHLVFWCLEELWVPDLTDTSKTKGRQGREDGEERWKVKARCSCTIVQYLPIPRAFSVDFKQVERFAVSSLTLTSHKGFPSLKTILRPFTIWNICPTQLPPYYRSLIICQVTHCCLLIRSWIWSCSSGICSLFLFFRLKGRAFQTFPAALIR